jgi:hypothetical protein
MTAIFFVFCVLLALTNARVSESLARRRAFLAQPMVTAPRLTTSTSYSVYLWLWTTTQRVADTRSVRVFLNETASPALSATLVRTTTFATLVQNRTGPSCASGKCSCGDFADPAGVLANSVFVVDEIANLPLGTRVRFDVAIAGVVVESIAFRTPAARKLRFAHGSCGDDRVFSNAAVTAARLHARGDALEFFLINGDSSYGRGMSFSADGETYGDYKFSFTAVSTDMSRTRESDWCDMSHQLRRHLFARNNPMMRDIYENMPVIANWDDHDFGPNDFFGVASSSDSGETSIAAMRSATSFDRSYGSRAFKAIWPSLYSEYAGAAGIEHSLSVSPIADLLITDTRYHASVPNKERFESGAIARIGALCQSSTKPVLVLAIASTMLLGSAAITVQGASQMPLFVSTLNSTACRAKAIVLLTGDVHYASMHANVLSMSHVFEFTSSSLARDEPTRAPKCPETATNGTQRLFTTGYVNNFGVVNIELDSADKPTITHTLYSYSGAVLANVRWEPNAPASGRLRASIDKSICAAPALAPIDFTAASPAPVTPRTAVVFDDSKSPHSVTYVPRGTAFRPLFVLGDSGCLADNSSASTSKLSGASYYSGDGVIRLEVGSDQRFDAVTLVPTRNSVESDAAIKGFALLWFHNGLLAATDAKTGAELFNTAYYRLPGWPAHWTSIDAATFVNTGAKVLDAADENGRLLVFRGLEFIVYNVARCYGRGDVAACKSSTTSRDFGLQLVDDISSLFQRPCAHVSGVRQIQDCFNSTEFPRAAIEANGGIDGALFTFSGAWTTPNLNISGYGEGTFDFFVGSDVYRATITEAAGLSTWSTARVRTSTEYGRCFPIGPTTTTTTSSGQQTTTSTSDNGVSSTGSIADSTIQASVDGTASTSVDVGSSGSNSDTAMSPSVDLTIIDADASRALLSGGTILIAMIGVAWHCVMSK